MVYSLPLLQDDSSFWVVGTVFGINAFHLRSHLHEDSTNSLLHHSQSVKQELNKTGSVATSTYG